MTDYPNLRASLARTLKQGLCEAECRACLHAKALRAALDARGSPTDYLDGDGWTDVLEAEARLAALEREAGDG